MWGIQIVTIATLLMVAYGQDLGECRRPPKVRPDTCCPALPKYLTPETVSECGFKHPENKTHGIPPCENMNCLLAKKGLLTSDNKIDRAAVRAFVDSEYSSEWKPALDNVLQKCFAVLDNANECEAITFIACFASNIMANCPESLWTNSNECSEVKTFFQNCIKY